VVAQTTFPAYCLLPELSLSLPLARPPRLQLRDRRRHFLLPLLWCSFCCLL
jgi:hypothetical protein